MECLPRKIPIPPESAEKGSPFRVTPASLDPNGHLTSAMYFAIAGDALPPDCRFNRVRMEFKKQIKSGHTVQPMRYDTADGRHVVDLLDDEGTSCAVAEFSTWRDGSED